MVEAFERRSARAGVRAPATATASARPPAHPPTAWRTLCVPGGPLKESHRWARRRSPSTEEPATSSRSTTRSRPGLVLTGTEIKSIRARKVNLADAYVRIDRGEAWLYRHAHRAVGDRQPLQPRGEADPEAPPPSGPDHPAPVPDEAEGPDDGPAQALPTERGRAKVEVGLARGKQLHDRRRDIAERDSRRDVARELADVRRGR